MVCLGAQDANAGLVAPAEGLQLLSVKSTHGALQVFDHRDEEVAPELSVLVMRLQMCSAVGGQTLEAGADRPLRRWTDVTGHLSSFQRRWRLLPPPFGVVQLQLRQGGEMGPAEGALAEPVDPPVLADAAQTEAVSTGEEHRAAEAVQTDAAPEGLRHPRAPRGPAGRLLKLAPKTNTSVLVGCCQERSQKKTKTK